MRFFHISDLHIGKRVCGFSMLGDQKYILRQILDLSEEYRPDGFLIAGDLYDKSMPPAEAVEVVDWFLTEAVRRGNFVWAISGNHDCAERIAYGSALLERSGLHLSRVFDGHLQKYTFEKEGGEKADLYLLPFLRPAQVRGFFPEQKIETTQQAVEAVLASVQLAKDRPNLLLMHQFMAGASVCDSEEVSVGGSDQVSASVADAFDYVALGHLHGPQRVGRDAVRYCGSPLKYSFSEANQKKTLTIIDINGEPKAPWDLEITQIPLRPRHDLREIKGPIQKLLSPEVYLAADREDYLHVTLTDREGVLDAMGKLREIYPNIMRLDFERTDAKVPGAEERELREKSREELFEEFYEKQNGEALSERQKKLLREVWDA